MEPGGVTLRSIRACYHTLLRVHDYQRVIAIKRVL